MITTTTGAVENVLWQDVLESQEARLALADLYEERGRMDVSGMLRSGGLRDLAVTAWMVRESIPAASGAPGAAGELLLYRLLPGGLLASGPVWEEFAGAPVGVPAGPGEYCSLIGLGDLPELCDTIGEFAPLARVRVLFGHECCLVFWFV